MITGLQVAQDLTEIVDLSVHLAAAAIANANDELMPGGLAMVALADVANLEAVSWHGEDETPEDVWEPPLQTLLKWSEGWRRIHNRETDRRPTLVSEADFVRRCLDWAMDNEPRWEEFAKDVHRARTRLEDLLHDGRRNKRGVPCLSCTTPLVRYSKDRHEPRHCTGHDGVCTWPHRRCELHDRGGLVDQWRCPSCDRRYTAEDYVRAVHQAHVAHGEYLPVEDAIARTGATRGSIQGWASKGLVGKRKHVLSGRMTYRVLDIEIRLRRDETELAEEATR